MSQEMVVAPAPTALLQSTLLALDDKLLGAAAMSWQAQGVQAQGSKHRAATTAQPP
jgi:hypothetical protein